MMVREYTLDFYTVQILSDQGRERHFHEVLEALLGADDDKVRVLSGVNFELRALGRSGIYYTGVVAKFRTRDLPHAALPGGRERELDLEDEEGLIEKSHFVYVRGSRVLMLQRNRLGVGPGNFGRYFSNLIGDTTVCHPVLQRDAMRRLIHHAGEIKEIDIAVARPGARMLARPDGRVSWDGHIIGLLNSTGAYRIRTTIKANGHAHDAGRFLRQNVLGPFNRLFNDLNVGRARVKYEPTEDDPGIVDLLRDRMSATVVLDGEGKYPNSEAMWTAAQVAWREHRAAVREVLADDDTDDQ